MRTPHPVQSVLEAIVIGLGILAVLSVDSILNLIFP
jgi:hypothetical protein